MNQLCKVCGEPAAGFHFGAFTCEGCKSFFGRTYNNVSGVSECKNGGRCEITKKNRTSCKSCRLRKCLSVGMSKSGSRYGRRSNWFKIHCLLSAQSQGGNSNGNGLSSSSPEANNNSTSAPNNNNTNHIKSTSTVTSLSGSHNLSHHLSLSDSDRDRERSERDRRSSSERDRASSSVRNSLPLSMAVPNLSPESREQFLNSLNMRGKMGNQELMCDYFRVAAAAAASNNGKPFYTDDVDRDSGDLRSLPRSPQGSLDSPNSEVSGDEKSTTPLFTLPPGSPLDMKQNELLSFDLLTRDLMKLGYDPLRLWPAMLGGPPNLTPFNPYRFIFPNFPAAGFPPGFPPPPSPLQSQNGHVHPSKLLAAAAAAAAGADLSSLPRQNLSSGLPQLSGRSKFSPIVPPSSSLTLTPPISTHGSDGSCPKFRQSQVPIQEKPIDLSAKGNNNNEDFGFSLKLKREREPIGSDLDEDMDEDEGDSFRNSPAQLDLSRDREPRSDFEEDYEDEEDEDDSRSGGSGRGRSRTRNHMGSSRNSSCSSPSRKRDRVSTPLDLTRSGTGNPPAAKIPAT